MTRFSEVQRSCITECLLTRYHSLTKAKKAGGFAETAPEEMMLEFFKGVIAKSNIDPALVEDIVMGNTLETAMAYKGQFTKALKVERD